MVNYYFGRCKDSVVVPINWESFRTLISKIRPTQEELMLALGEGFLLQWDALGSSSLCSPCVLSGGACGYNQSTRAFTCYCQDQAYASTCERRSGTQTYPIQSPNPVGSSNQVTLAKGRSNRVSLAVGLAVAGSTIVASIVLAIAWWLLTLMRRGKTCPPIAAIWQENTKQDEKIETFIMNYCSLLPSRYSYSDIKKITNSFTDKLGQGGFGVVYKGKLSDGRLVAVKVLSESEGDGEDFINEVASIGRTSHVNIVTLLGYCFERRKRALIYQYMPNGSLDRFICHQRSQKTEWRLDWKILYDVAIGIARGLEYLHSGCNARIVHLDIKPHNILLDEDLCPKICDFGMAKLCKGKESKVSMLGTRGTVGYIAPEVISRSFGEVSSKSDVYSYGMMVLEMVGARRNFENGVSRTSEKYFPDWIYQQLEQGEASRQCDDVTREEEETARKMVLVGLWCIQTNPSHRPSMAKVIEMLEGSLQSLQTPPKPYLHSPKRSLEHYSSISSKVPYTCSQRAETEELPFEVVDLQME